MPKYTADDCRKLMDDVTAVRNVALIGAMGHGKTVLMDNFGAKCGYIAENKIGETLFALLRDDEKQKKSNIKTNPHHLVMEAEYTETTEDDKGELKMGETKTKKFLYTMMDTPGHLEFSPEAVGAMRMADGALYCVDVTGDVPISVEYQIADSLRERVKPALFINKLDKAIMIQKIESEELYQMMSSIVTDINVALHPAEEMKLKGYVCDPLRGNVMFGSALFGWAFTVQQFASLYNKKMGMPMDKMLPRLWGDSHYNAAKKSFTKAPVEGSVRSMCKFILDPIITIHNQIMAGDDAWMKTVEKLGVVVKEEDKKLKGSDLLKRVMSTWMNCADTVCSVIATHLPNPKVGQKGKIAQIFQGAPEGKEFTSMDTCDPEGELMFQAVKMMPTGSGRFYALGRCFGGTVKTDKYQIRGPGHDPEDPETFGHCNEDRVQSLNFQMGRDLGSIRTVPAGNICLLGGCDTHITKSATITSSKKVANFAGLKFIVSPVVRVAIKPNDQKQLPKLVEGMKRLQKGDMLVTTTQEQATGDHIVGGCGDEHLKNCLSDLRNEYACIALTEGVPTISYKETITYKTEKQALSKSPNNHNRLYVIAEPIEEDMNIAMEANRINPQQEAKKRNRIMIDEFGWDKAECAKIWGFGPVGLDVGPSNLVVDLTKGIQYMNEIKEHVNSGLLWASGASVLAEETMRGVRFNLMDCKLHPDSIHRGQGQIQPTARRVFYGAVMTSGARFMEPIYKIVVGAPESVAAGVKQAINGKRGITDSEEDSGNKVLITAFLPVAETIGGDSFSKVLQTKTSGKAVATYAFDHWKLVNTDPLVPGSKASDIMLEIRSRKGLKVEHPLLSDYVDRL